jgi:opacity protein-like surface antigen/outer membrane protease
MKKFLLAGVALAALAAANPATAADLPVKAPPPVLWSWQGLYGGFESGAAWGITNFSDPFGPSIFGDNVRTPGYFFGADVGHNWQLGQWVWGVELNGDWLTAEGTNTCGAFSGFYVSSNCRSRPNAFGSATVRLGHTFAPADRTLFYVKGGVAWIHNDLTSTVNNLFGLFPQPPSNQVSASAVGWTVGAGIERALTPAWSLKFEYDYMDFHNLGSIGISPSIVAIPSPIVTANIPALFFVAPGATSTVKENLQVFKMGLNYHFGHDPWAPGWDEAAPRPSYPVKAAPIATAWAPGWEFEVGARYWYSSGRFQKDLPAGPLNDQSLISRLTYADLTGHSGEVFGRIDSPWRLFAKGMIGGGSLTSNGHQNDEDWGLGPAQGFPIPVAYSNTIAQPVNGPISYVTADVGIDLLRGPGYKVGPFVGYNYFRSKMNAYGCTQIANPNSDCVPPNNSPSSVLGIVEDDKWQSFRLGTSADVLLFDRLRINGEVAYLPYVKFTGEDDHLQRVPPLTFVEDGHGRGVQAEVIMSYMLTNQWSIGAGARYWAMWTTSGTDAVGGVIAQRNDTYRVERYGFLLQTSYKFDAPTTVVAKY